MFGQHEKSDRLPDRGADREQTVIGQDKQSMRAESRGEAGADHQIDDVKLLAVEDRLVAVECACLLARRTQRPTTLVSRSTLRQSRSGEARPT